MSTYVLREKISYFMLGVLSVLIIVLLTGAASINPVGKYQMETIARNNTTHVYVMDTTNGQVKWVNEMNTPFNEMKGD